MSTKINKIFCLLTCLSFISAANSALAVDAAAGATAGARNEKSAGVPSKLPAMKKRTKINFEENSGTHATTVVVRTPLPLDQVQQEVRVADENVKDFKETLVEVKSQSALNFSLTPTKKPVQTATVIATARATEPAPPANLLSPTPSPTQISPQNSPQNSIVARASAPTEPEPELRFYARTTYLDAHYSQLESDLQNGATTIALGIARDFSRAIAPGTEGRLTLEIGHGLDQAVTVQNTRFLIVRTDAVYGFLPGAVTPLVSLGVGYGNFNVRSERASSSGDTTTREHAKGEDLIVAPAAGVRVRFGAIALDLTAEYVVLAGPAPSSSLGGLAGALGLSFAF